MLSHPSLLHLHGSVSGKESQQCTLLPCLNRYWMVTVSHLPNSKTSVKQTTKHLWEVREIVIVTVQIETSQRTSRWTFFVKQRPLIAD
jgi:hypothetical protein